MSRRNKKRSQKRKRQARSSKAESGTLEVVQCEVVTGPMPDPDLDRLSTADRERVEKAIEKGRDLFHGNRRDTDTIVAELEGLVEEFPHVRRLYNSLATAYQVAGREEAMKRVVYETYERFPDYLFAVTNYVKQCLVDGNVREAQRVLQGREALHLLGGGRRKFHHSEYVAYMATMIHYYIELGDWGRARNVTDCLAQVEPNHPILHLP